MNIDENAEISQIEFSIWSADEIRATSVAEINKSNLSGPNTVYDPRLGITSNRGVCQTCDSSIKTCPGHFGSIELTHPISHPLYTTQIINFLKCFCDSCYKLRLTTDQLLLLGFDHTKITTQLKQQQYITSVLKQVSKIEFCPHCSKWLPDFYANDGQIYKFYTNKDINYPISDTEIHTIFQNIRQSEVSKLGIHNHKIHPENLIITVLAVLPSAARPACVVDNSNTKDDDLTFKYVEIIKANNKLKLTTLSEGERQSLIDQLRFHIRTMFDNSKGLARQVNGRPIKAFKERLNGKSGLLRWHLSGKRVDFSARSVIGPDPMLDTDEIVVPHEIATSQTFPERVYDRNRNYLQNLVDNDQANYVIRNGNRKDLNYILKPGFKLNDNDIIFSVNGDEFASVLDALKVFFKLSSVDFIDKFKCVHELQTIFNTSDWSKTLDNLPPEIDIINPFIYKTVKNKDYVIQKGDCIWRNRLLFCDLAYEGFKFMAGDALYRNDEIVKIDGFGLDDQNQPVFIHKDQQVSLESSDIIKRNNLFIGHLKIQTKIHFQLKDGDIVERHLKTGDIIPFGRQPSLHKGSLLARKIRIIEQQNPYVNNGKHVKTIRMPLSVTKTYNADFDDKLSWCYKLNLV